MNVFSNSPAIHFDSLDVRTIENNSGIFIGRNRHLNWRSVEISRSGFGGIYGRKNDHSSSAYLVLKEDGNNKVNLK
ncbi:hypothetical protein [Bacillus sp. P14.5]|uniref:hypothetical protein n=1 Tax=Bacillus sp. P14.5 TaxID=1983400 RepID=UPI000DE8A526|nr:hypothetical protein [Bacillus sp. P14.5]